MTVLDWPELRHANRDELCAELGALIEQIVNEDVHALDTLDDQFARMVAALLTLLKTHELDNDGRCSRCPTRPSGCDVLETVQQHLKQPLTLLWWHVHKQRDNNMPIDEVGAWLAASQTPRPWDRPADGHGSLGL